MAKKRSEAAAAPTPLEALRGKDPASLSPSDIQRLFDECERKIAIFELFVVSDEWKIMRARLEKRRESLQNEMLGLVKRLGRPVEGQPPVTTDQITYQQGRIDENADLLVSPNVTLQLWRNEREGLHHLRETRT